MSISKVDSEVVIGIVSVLQATTHYMYKYLPYTSVPGDKGGTTDAEETAEAGCKVRFNIV